MVYSIFHERTKESIVYRVFRLVDNLESVEKSRNGSNGYTKRISIEEVLSLMEGIENKTLSWGSIEPDLRKGLRQLYSTIRRVHRIRGGNLGLSPQTLDSLEKAVVATNFESSMVLENEPAKNSQYDEMLEKDKLNVLSNKLQEAFSILKPIEVELLKARYGIGYDRAHSLEESTGILESKGLISIQTGKKYTRERARQIQAKAEKRLKDFFEGRLKADRFDQALLV